MAGTVAGGKKAAAKNLAEDPDFYSKIGRIGGSISRGGYFSDRSRGEDGLTNAQRSGILGGKASRRTKHE